MKVVKVVNVTSLLITILTFQFSCNTENSDTNGVDSIPAQENPSNIDANQGENQATEEANNQLITEEAFFLVVPNPESDDEEINLDDDLKLIDELLTEPSSDDNEKDSFSLTRNIFSIFKRSPKKPIPPLPTRNSDGIIGPPSLKDPGPINRKKVIFPTQKNRWEFNSNGQSTVITSRYNSRSNNTDFLLKKNYRGQPVEIPIIPNSGSKLFDELYESNPTYSYQRNPRGNGPNIGVPINRQDLPILPPRNTERFVILREPSKSTPGKDIFRQARENDNGYIRTANGEIFYVSDVSPLRRATNGDEYTLIRIANRTPAL